MTNKEKAIKLLKDNASTILARTTLLWYDFTIAEKSLHEIAIAIDNLYDAYELLLKSFERGEFNDR